MLLRRREQARGGSSAQAAAADGRRRRRLRFGTRAFQTVSSSQQWQLQDSSTGQKLYAGKTMSQLSTLLLFPF